MFKNTAGQLVAFAGIVRADGTDGTGVSPTVTVSVDGGAAAGGGGTVTEVTAGCFKYTPTQAETNGDHVVFVFKQATLITQVINVYPIDVALYKADVSGLSTFDPAADTVANVASVTNPVITDTASRDASKADVSGLATQTELDKVPKKDAAQTWTNQAGDTQTVTITQS
jgi:hypothetical protein